MQEALIKMGEIGIVPVVVIDDPKDAVPVAKALQAGGIPIAEITFRTAAAHESIQRIGAEVPEILLGAGTVLTVDQAKKAIDAGAKFIVSPGFNEKVVDFCLQANVPITPGVSTGSEIEMALEKKLEVLKFFPAEPLGGLKTLKALAGPYTTVKFYPTGGIGPENLSEYASYDRIFASGGSWMVKPDLIAAKRFDEITRLSKEAVDIILGFEFAHLGINAKSEEEAATNASSFKNLFSFIIKPGASSIFATNAVELCKSIMPGEHGHIAIRTNNLNRAVAYLKNKGIKTSGEMKMKNGKPVSVYIDVEIGHFAVHLLQK
jgi:2-dehydro-3-deoxyphosphogluconate aldolase/(4S)-4-hydroxy-2-oxoglutarate aldolase